MGIATAHRRRSQGAEIRCGREHFSASDYPGPFGIFCYGLCTCEIIGMRHAKLH